VISVSLDTSNIERVRMLLNGEEMSRNSYVIPTSVLQRLLDAAAAHYRVRLLCVQSNQTVCVCFRERMEQSDLPVITLTMFTAIADEKKIMR